MSSRHALRQFSMSNYSLRKQKKTTRKKIEKTRGVNLEKEKMKFESNFVILSIIIYILQKSQFY